MTVVLMPKAKPPEEEKTRNRTGCANIFRKNMDRGERITLAQAIELLKLHW